MLAPRAGPPMVPRFLFPFASVATIAPVAIIAIAALLAGTTASQAAPRQDSAPTADVRELLVAGEAAIAHRDYPAAVALFERAVTLTPDAPPAHVQLGRALTLARRFGEAVDHLTRAVELGARDVPTRLYLAAALWEVGRLAEAESTYRELVAASGRPPLAVHQLGRLLAWQGRPAEAVPLLIEAAAARPADLDLRLDLAHALAGAGRLTEAETAYRVVLERAPDLAGAHSGLARVLARLEKLQEAGEVMSRYGELVGEEERRLRRAGLEQARLDRGWELLRQGNAAAALAHFGKLPEGDQSLTGQALAHSALGDHEEAAALLERAVALAPERQELRRMLTEERLAVEER